MKRILYVMLAAAAVGVAVPATGSAQAAAAICKDGTSSAVSGRGACSSHGGVDKKATSAAEKAAKNQAKAAKAAAAKAAQVTCTDGTMSKPGRGACGHHGGIKGSAAPNAAPAPAPAAPARPQPAPSSAPAPSRTTARAGPSAPAATGGSGKSEDNNPTGAIAKCKDGMYSHSAHRQGACSRHGGVSQWLTT